MLDTYHVTDRVIILKSLQSIKPFIPCHPSDYKVPRTVLRTVCTNLNTQCPISCPIRPPVPLERCQSERRTLICHSPAIGTRLILIRSTSTTELLTCPRTWVLLLSTRIDLQSAIILSHVFSSFHSFYPRLLKHMVVLEAGTVRFSRVFQADTKLVLDRSDSIVAVAPALPCAPDEVILEWLLKSV